MEYPKEFEFDALLKDGRVIRFRPFRPEDPDRDRQFFQWVGPESAYFRFFRMKSDLGPEELRHFTTVDYDDRMAFIAIYEDHMVAVGRSEVLPEKSDEDHKVAEVAFLVQDDYQGRGVGSHLLRHLTVYARLRGITEFEAFVLADNRAMPRLFRDSGYKLTRQLEEAIYRVEFTRSAGGGVGARKASGHRIAHVDPLPDIGGSNRRQPRRPLHRWSPLPHSPGAGLHRAPPDLSVHTQHDLDAAARTLNGRPRQTLGIDGTIRQTRRSAAIAT